MNTMACISKCCVQMLLYKILTDYFQPFTTPCYSSSTYINYTLNTVLSTGYSLLTLKQGHSCSFVLEKHLRKQQLEIYIN